MSKNLSNSEKELNAIIDALADSLLGTPDSEILREAQEEGENVEAEVKKVRNVLLNAIKAHQQRRLREAKSQYERRVTGIRERKYGLPSSPEEQRSLLEVVFSRNPGIRSSLLTAQYREFTDLSDADIEGCLEQLKDLGILDELIGGDR